MENTLIFIGKVLGEVYRLQKKLAPELCNVQDERIYGLLHGFEESIQEEFDALPRITREKVDKVDDILYEFEIDPKKIKSFKGFYDIQDKLKDEGISRYEFRCIFTKFLIEGKYHSLKNMFDTNLSPHELRIYDIDAEVSKL